MTSAFSSLLVPKLRLGMTVSPQLCCLSRETEFPRHVRPQTAFRNGGQTPRHSEAATGSADEAPVVEMGDSARCLGGFWRRCAGFGCFRAGC